MSKLLPSSSATSETSNFDGTVLRGRTIGGDSSSSHTHLIADVIDAGTWWDTRLATKTTTNLTEGTNLYFTDARADARVQEAIDTDGTFSSTSDTEIASTTAIKTYVDSQSLQFYVTDGTNMTTIETNDIITFTGTGAAQVTESEGTVTIDATDTNTNQLTTWDLTDGSAYETVSHTDLIEFDRSGAATVVMEGDGSTMTPYKITVGASAADIKSEYESNDDTNAFQNADQTKLDEIEALADVTDTANVNSAGAVMETDYAATSFLYATSDNTPQPKTPTQVREILSVEDGSTADQTDAEIRAAVEAADDSNVFTNDDHTKLNEIEALADVTDSTNVNSAGAVMETDYDATSFLYATSDNTPQPKTPTQVREILSVEDGSTADQTDAEIRAAVEAADDSNVFTNDDHTKLNNISGTNTGDEPDASLTEKGIVKLATTGETTDGTDTTKAVTPAGVQAAVDDLVGAAPGALDTLNELAAAIGDDADYATTVTNALALKAPINNPTFTNTVTTPDLNLTSMTNAGADTDKFLVLDSGNNVDFRTGTEVLTDIGAMDASTTTITTAQANAIVANTAKTGITTAQANAITANTAKVTNVTTDLSVSRDGTKLDVVSSDGTNAVLPLADTDNWGVMSDEMFDKLDGIEAGATAGGEANVNADWDSSSGDSQILNKPTTISSSQASAITANTAKVTNVSTNLSVVRDGSKLEVHSSDGDNAVLPLADTDNWGVMSDEMFDKLDGIATGATANDTDANLKARGNHTGTQAASTISDFDTEVANNSAVAANTAKVTNATHTGEVTGSGALTIADDIVDEANLKADNSPTDDYVLTAKSSAAGGLTWASGGSGTGDSLLDADSDTKIQVEESADEDKIRFDTAGSERMIIDASGNVGIGTNSPAQTLEIHGGTFIDGTSSHGIPGSPATLIVDGASGRDILNLRDVGANVKMAVDDAGNTTLTGDLTASGNVGIGTTSPDELLTIEGAGNEFIRVVGGGSGYAAAGIKLETTSGSNRPSGVYMFSDVAENTWYMGRKYGADEWCVSRKGSTSSTDESTSDGANALLTVATDGAVDLIDSKLKVGGSYGSDGQVLTSTGSGVAWENASGGGGSGGHAIKDEGGSALTARANLNFTGELVGATDDSGNDATDVTIDAKTLWLYAA